jgi:hypothetical protein
MKSENLQREVYEHAMSLIGRLQDSSSIWKVLPPIAAEYLIAHCTGDEPDTFAAG